MEEPTMFSEMEELRKIAAQSRYNAEAEDFARKSYILFKNLCAAGFTREEALQITIETLRMGKK